MSENIWDVIKYLNYDYSKVGARQWCNNPRVKEAQRLLQQIAEEQEAEYRSLNIRIAALEAENALLNEALDGAVLEYYSDHEHPQYGYGARSMQKIREDWLYEAQMMLDVKARAEAAAAPAEERETDETPAT